MNRYRILFALVPFLILAPFCVNGATSRTSGPVDITARELKYNREQNIYTAEGDVEMIEGTKRLTADFVLFNDTTKDAFAEGHVVFQDAEDVVHGERISLNLVTNRGTIENGRIFVKKGNFFLTGQEIEKTGESTYKVREGEFTTCGFDRPAWTFKAKDVDLTVGGYATTSHTTFSVMGYPLVYMPWGVFPVKTERQSGFLLPEIQLSSRDGAIFRDAYFWAIDKDKDATFYFDWIQDRGVKPGAEFRYTPSESTKGVWYATGLSDDKYDRTRYQVKGQHEQLFGDLSFKADVNRVSDFDYLKDLGVTTTERSENSLRSVAFAEKPFSRSLLTAETAYFQTLSQKNNDATVQYLPFVSYFTEYIPLVKRSLYTDLSTALTNFERSTGETFTRLSVQPTVRMPYSLNGLNFLFSGGVLENAYLAGQNTTNQSDTQHHETLRAEGDMNARFVKNTYTDLFDLGQIRSVIVPRVRYTYIKNNQSVSSVPSIDPSDRLADSNTVTYSFNHYLSAVTDGVAREISLIEIEQTYGLSQNLESQPLLYYGSGNRLSDIHARFTFYPHGAFSFSHEDVLSVYGQGLTLMRNSVYYNKPGLFQMDVSHSYTKDSVNELWLNTVTRWKSFDGIYQIRYSFLDNSWVDMLAALTYHPSCWGITLSMTKTRRPQDTSFHLSFSLQGIAQSIGGL